jgi:GNAT superfamily N-acetyltransferase
VLAAQPQAQAVSEAKILDLDVSPMRPDELGFVASAWKRSYSDAPANDALPLAKYYARINRQFDALMARPDVAVLVARDPERPDTLFGFVCFEPGDEWALHYVFTRKSHRRLGVASELLRRALEGAEPERLIYTAATRFDDVWERWGFERCDLVDWLKAEEAA